MRLSASVVLVVISCVTFSLFSAAESKSESLSQADVGWSSYVQFAGSLNSYGQIYELNPNVGYTFTQHFGMDFGVPVYFVNASSSNTGAISGDGLGNPYVDLRGKFLNPAFNYATVLTGAAPLGDSKLGLSTGRATFDWTNQFDHSFNRVTPFIEAGLSNTTVDTQLFVRPYTTLGMNAHLLGGARIEASKRVGFGGSLYDIAPFGNQTVFSRVVSASNRSAALHGHAFQNAQQTTGTSSIASDNGFSTFIVYSPNRVTDAELGYTRSVQYGLNTVSFSLGFNAGRLFREGR